MKKVADNSQNIILAQGSNIYRIDLRLILTHSTTNRNQNKFEVKLHKKAGLNEFLSVHYWFNVIRI